MELEAVILSDDVCVDSSDMCVPLGITMEVRKLVINHVSHEVGNSKEGGWKMVVKSVNGK